MSEKPFSSVTQGTLAISVLVCITLACADPGRDAVNRGPSTPVTNSAAKTVASVIDVPKLMRQSPQEFEKLFGKATEVSKTNYPGTVPGEIRDYKLEGAGKFSTASGVMVRFFRNKAVMNMVDLPSPTGSSADALRQAGINTKGLAPTVQATLADRWRNEILNGTSFKDVAAHRLDSESRNFTTVQAEVNH